MRPSIALMLAATLAAACSSTQTNPTGSGGAAGKSSGGSGGVKEGGATGGIAGTTASGGAGDGCVPGTCASLGAACGTLPDLCGGILNCVCPPDQVCDAASGAGQCWGPEGTWNVIWDRCGIEDFMKCVTTETWIIAAGTATSSVADSDCTRELKGTWATQYASPYSSFTASFTTDSCPAGACNYGCSNTPCGSVGATILAGTFELPKWNELLLTVTTSGPPCNGQSRVIDMLRL
jgi:hypothetical protein